jgi:hypothetical protein
MAVFAALTGALAAVAAAALAWIAGFHSVAACLRFWSLGACAIAAAVRIGRRFFRGDGAAGSIIRLGTLTFAIVVAAELLLGSAGLLFPAAHFLLFGGLFAATLTLRQPSRRRTIRADRAVLLLIAALVPLLILVVAAGISQSPLTLYDSLSYHLAFPARWLLDRRLSIVPTPFGDEAQAYAPANGELFFLWLMMPFHGDALARIGQLPFYLLGGTALYGLARQAGARPAHAVFPPLFYFFSRPIVEQALGADVDLICWAMFLSSIYFANIAAARDDRRDWLLWGISAGLYCGSKYVALVYLPIVLAFAVQRGIHRRMTWALPGVLIFGAPWYLRNWIVAGSPIYPSSLTVAGQTLARGAYSRGAMLQSVFHTSSLRLFPVMAAHAMGATLLLLWIPAAILGGWAMIATGRRTTVWLAAAPIVMSLLFWFGVPDNVDSRFLLAAAMLALLPFAFVFRASRTWNALAVALLAAGVCWLVVGRSGQLPGALPWYMTGWLSLGGIVGRSSLIWFAGMEAIALALAFVLIRAPRADLAALLVLCAAGSSLFAYGSDVWCVPSRCQFLTPTPIYLRTELIYAWRWVDDNVDGATIAYTGDNVPYPLFGDHLVNRVYYVNIDRHRDWRFDDYAKAHRHRRPDSASLANQYATPSGVLIPIDEGAPQIDAVRPRFERWDGLREAWIDNLRARGVDLLFVMTLSPYEIDHNWHDARGFPIEATWAQSDSALFTRVFVNSRVQIFAVRAP